MARPPQPLSGWDQQSGKRRCRGLDDRPLHLDISGGRRCLFRMEDKGPHRDRPKVDTVGHEQQVIALIRCARDRERGQVVVHAGVRFGQKRAQRFAICQRFEVTVDQTTGDQIIELQRKSFGSSVKAQPPQVMNDIARTENEHAPVSQLVLGRSQVEVPTPAPCQWRPEKQEHPLPGRDISEPPKRRGPAPKCRLPRPGGSRGERQLRAPDPDGPVPDIVRHKARRESH